ncbi:NUDIX hydrolase [Longispora albida]|uniref:NUDIX hydrolase n=1 Tax=Longispora albida TaxID=203523 RepID=UPI000365BC8A|nr:NUDIX domain-containing protein [Longispora albida]
MTDPARVLPEWLVERARAWAAEPGTPVEPRRAATVLILRDTPAGVEVYLLRRATTMAFAAAMHAFPGGAAEPGDADIEATARREVEEETGLVLGELYPWSRWITPEFEPRRYDTDFFVARLPEGASPQYTEGGEADKVVWLRPADAVTQHAAGALAMLPPTVETLRQIMGYPDVAAVLAAAAGRDALTAIVPRAVLVEGGARMVLPGEDGY